MLSLVSAHILHLILETDFYFYSHNDCILQDFKAVVNVSTEDLKLVHEMLCEYILKETIDRKGNFYNGAP
jgi:nicotinic acid phosphoribosyltransferase